MYNMLEQSSKRELQGIFDFVYIKTEEGLENRVSNLSKFHKYSEI